MISGPSLIGKTVNVNVWVSEYSPSLTETSISIEPKKLSDGINVKILSSTDNEPDRFDNVLLVIIFPEYVKSSLSISFANNS